MTRVEEYEELVDMCAVEAFHTWDIFAHSPRIDGECPADRALRGMHVVARAVLAVIAEKAEEWPTEGMVEAWISVPELSARRHAREWRAMLAASPFVKPEDPK